MGFYKPEGMKRALTDAQFRDICERYHDTMNGLDYKNKKREEQAKKNQHDDLKYRGIVHILFKELEKRNLNISYKHLAEITRSILAESKYFSSRFNDEDVDKIVRTALREYNNILAKDDNIDGDYGDK